MTDINLKTLTPDTSLPTTGFLFGADSQASTNPSVYSTQTVATTLLGSTSLTGDTLTASAPVLNLAQTWNNGAVTFTGIKFNVPTNTSNASSRLMDLQVGGGTYFAFKPSNFEFQIGGANGQYCFIRPTGTQQTDSLVFGSSFFGNFFTVNPFALTLQNTSSLIISDAIISRRGTANLRFGAADAAVPVAQTLSVQSIVGGGGTPNLSAAAYPFKITGAQGTGQGAGGSIIFQTAPAAVSSGNGQNGLTDALTIDSVGSVQIVRALTVATLPGTPLAGMIARVSDALAPVIGSTVAGGGAAYALVNYNGSNWTVIGV